MKQKGAYDNPAYIHGITLDFHFYKQHENMVSKYSFHQEAHLQSKPYVITFLINEEGAWQD